MADSLQIGCFDMETDVLYNENCLDGLKIIPNESIDLVVTDPPYKITPRGNHGTSSGMLANKLSMRGKIFTDNDTDIEQWLPDIYRVLKDGTHCYIMTNNLNLTHYLQVIDDSQFHFIRLLVWDKRSKIMGTKYMGQVEFIIMCSKGANRQISDCGCSDLLSIPIHKLKDKNGNNYHDTEKPVQLMEILIRNSSETGGVILDPFAGIGATLLAAQKSKRHYIGFEINEKYYHIAEKRLYAQLAQPTLF